MIKLTVVNNTENQFKIVLLADGAPIDHTTLTGAELRTKTGLTIADSDTDPTDWDFTNTGYLLVKLGLTQLIPGFERVTLVVKDAAHLTGLAWDSSQLYLTILP